MEMKFTALDLVSLEECLESYKKLIANTVTENELDVVMKEDRLRIITHLLNKCSRMIGGIKSNGGYC